jgi:hypothetical protein
MLIIIRQRKQEVWLRKLTSGERTSHSHGLATLLASPVGGLKRSKELENKPLIPSPSKYRHRVYFPVASANSQSKVDNSLRTELRNFMVPTIH